MRIINKIIENEELFYLIMTFVVFTCLVYAAFKVNLLGMFTTTVLLFIFDRHYHAAVIKKAIENKAIIKCDEVIFTEGHKQEEKQ